MHRFFLIVPPGFEALAEAELLVWLQSFGFEPSTPISREKGGISLDLPLEIGFALNGRVKIPSRILLRLADFGCRDFPKLFKKVRGFDWEPWIFPGAPTPEFVASSHRSRLAIKKRIQSTCEDGFGAWRENKKLIAAETLKRPTVMVRFSDDVCTISLDTSGEHLHKRGYKTQTTEAPIRENIAAALLWFILPIDREVVLIDPMVGSGTFLTESLLLGQSLKREYSFEEFASVRNNIIKIADIVTKPTMPTVASAIGFDISADALKAAKANSEAAKLKIQLDAANLFEDQYEVPSGNRVVICNPPYGERMKIEGSLANHFSKLLHMIDQKLKPELIGVVLPSKVNQKNLRLPENWQAHSTLEFENGGLPVVFYKFARKN
jgi:putative N6-adenine-specific DNA methylase